jgi:hypothetical protein
MHGSSNNNKQETINRTGIVTLRLYEQPVE